MLNLASAISLGQALVAESRDGAPDLVVQSKERLESATQQTLAAVVERQRRLAAASEEDTRKLDVQADRLWSALRARLDACTALPAEQYPEAARAGEISEALFGEAGLGFLKASYPTQLTLMDAHLQRIREDGYEASINELVGPQYLAALRDVVERYRTMVAAMLTREETGTSDLSVELNNVRQAITDYAMRVYATADPTDPASTERAEVMLRPIVLLRERTRRRGQRVDETTTDADASNAVGVQ